MIEQYRKKPPKLSGGNKNKGLNINKNKPVKFMTVKKIVLLAFLSLLFLFLLLVFIFLNFYRPSAPVDSWGGMDFNEFFDNEIFEGIERPVNMTQEDRNTDCYTFLILGRDALGGQTDTIMLAMFNVKENTISILNIPRDTYVTERRFSGKINNALGRGVSNAVRDGVPRGEEATKAGLKYLKGMVHYTFGVPVHYHILIDLKGFKFLVDEIGGVEMYVPQDMYYNDPEQGLFINLKEGPRTLNGSEAEQLVRYRSGYATQDIGRIETQQKFVAALMKKLLRFDLKNINALFATATKYMETNISATDAAWFAQRILQVKLEDIRTHTVPGGWVYPHQVAYKQETMEIINKYYNPFRIPIPESNFNIDDKGATGTGNTKTDIDGVTMAELLR